MRGLGSFAFFLLMRVLFAAKPRMAGRVGVWVLVSLPSSNPSLVSVDQPGVGAAGFVLAARVAFWRPSRR